MTVPWKTDSPHYQHNGLKMISQTTGHHQSLHHLSERSQTHPIGTHCQGLLSTFSSRLKVLVTMYPQGLTQCLAYHFTSISKCSLSEGMTKEQLAFPFLLQLVTRPAEPILKLSYSEDMALKLVPWSKVIELSRREM